MLTLMLFLLAPAPVTVYVGPMSRDGFVDTDKGVRDSVKDLQRELLRQKGIRVTSVESEAAVSLYVLGRGTGPPSGDGSAINIPGPVVRFPHGATVQTPGTSIITGEKSRRIDVLLRAGEYERQLVGGDGDTETWSKCAKAIVKDVSAWVEANRERLAREVK